MNGYRVCSLCVYVSVDGIWNHFNRRAEGTAQYIPWESTVASILGHIDITINVS